MEEITVNENPWDFKYLIEIMSIISSKSGSHSSSDPLFSCIITLYILILLYFPHKFSLKVLLSPVLIITASLLLSLLRLGAIQRFHNLDSGKAQENEPNGTDERNRESSVEETENTDYAQEECIWVTCKTEPASEMQQGFEPTPSFEDTFVEWNVRAPLQAIYEEYEGEEAEEEEEDPNENERDTNDKLPARFTDRYPSLSLYYPESDSDSSSDADFAANGDWVSPEKKFFRWEEEDKEGLIEIALDFHGEEENLIEIDISHALA